MHELDRHSQGLLTESPYTRAKFMSKLDTSSLEKFQQSVEGYRDYFYREVIGKFDEALLPPQPRSRKAYDQPKWTGYEVVLDTFPDLIAYGILLVPKDIRPGERRPVVVCQHGLEEPCAGHGRGRQPILSRFCGQTLRTGLCYFRAAKSLHLSRPFPRVATQSQSLGKNPLFADRAPASTDNRLAQNPVFCGPRAHWILWVELWRQNRDAGAAPGDQLLPLDLSGDFNDWIWKNVSTRSSYSYAPLGEYEIFEFDLGSTFNHAEMAALIAPRPFMVERGHFDNVAPDEAVGYEFAKVRKLYEGELKLPDRCAIEWFNGPHMINGQGTFDFLQRNLSWP